MIAKTGSPLRGRLAAALKLTVKLHPEKRQTVLIKEY
jgi:hypothetical protein